MKTRARSAVRGFTLVELLVAMAIVAIIGVMALTGLTEVIRQQEIAQERSSRWREIQLAMRLVVQDLIPGDDSGMRILTCYCDSTGRMRFAAFGHVLLEEHTPGALGNPAGIITQADPVITEMLLNFADQLDRVAPVTFRHADLDRGVNLRQSVREDGVDDHPGDLFDLALVLFVLRHALQSPVVTVARLLVVALTRAPRLRRPLQGSPG